MTDNNLNEKLTRWAGVNLEHDWDNDIAGYRITGLYCTKCHRAEDFIGDDPCLPDFTSSLDAVFKWLVPKCRSVMLYEQGAPEVHNVVAEAYLGMSSGHFSGDTTPALALCKAIEQLIKETP